MDVSYQKDIWFSNGKTKATYVYRSAIILLLILSPNVNRTDDVTSDDPESICTALTSRAAREWR
jgi:hypothetical protein